MLLLVWPDAVSLRHLSVMVADNGERLNKQNYWLININPETYASRIQTHDHGMRT